MTTSVRGIYYGIVNVRSGGKSTKKKYLRATCGINGNFPAKLELFENAKTAAKSKSRLQEILFPNVQKITIDEREMITLKLHDESEFSFNVDVAAENRKWIEYCFLLWYIPQYFIPTEPNYDLVPQELVDYYETPKQLNAGNAWIAYFIPDVGIWHKLGYTSRLHVISFGSNNTLDIYDYLTKERLVAWDQNKVTKFWYIGSLTFVEVQDVASGMTGLLWLSCSKSQASSLNDSLYKFLFCEVQSDSQSASPAVSRRHVQSNHDSGIMDDFLFIRNSGGSFQHRLTVCSDVIDYQSPRLSHKPIGQHYPQYDASKSKPIDTVHSRRKYSISNVFTDHHYSSGHNSTSSDDHDYIMASGDYSSFNFKKDDVLNFSMNRNSTQHSSKLTGGTSGKCDIANSKSAETVHTKRQYSTADDHRYSGRSSSNNCDCSASLGVCNCPLSESADCTLAMNYQNDHTGFTSDKELAGHFPRSLSATLGDEPILLAPSNSIEHNLEENVVNSTGKSGIEEHCAWKTTQANMLVVALSPIKELQKSPSPSGTIDRSQCASLSEYNRLSVSYSCHDFRSHDNAVSKQARKAPSYTDISVWSTLAIEEVQKQALEKCKPVLIRKLDLSTLVPLLIAKDLLTLLDNNLLQSDHKTDEEKVEYLVQILPKKRKGWFEVFLKCLDESSCGTGNGVIAEALSLEYNELCGLSHHFNMLRQQISLPEQKVKNEENDLAQQLASFQSTTPLDIASIAEMVIPNMATKWFEMGLQLGVDSKDLTRIQHDSRDSREACRQMFMEWLSSVNKESSWGKIFQALTSKSVGENATAEKLIHLLHFHQ